MKPSCYLSLGSNQGDSVSYLKRALQSLSDTPGITVSQVSPVYSTPAWGKTDQPDFLNLCACVDTDLGAERLLDKMQEIEQTLGRVREVRWGQRTIDLDLLLYQGQRIDTPRLQVPHPYLLQRAFVLVPLSAICPHLTLQEKSIFYWLEKLDCQGIFYRGCLDWREASYLEK